MNPRQIEEVLSEELVHIPGTNMQQSVFRSIYVRVRKAHLKANPNVSRRNSLQESLRAYHALQNVDPKIDPAYDRAYFSLLATTFSVSAAPRRVRPEETPVASGSSV